MEDRAQSGFQRVLALLDFRWLGRMGNIEFLVGWGLIGFGTIKSAWNQGVDTPTALAIGLGLSVLVLQLRRRHKGGTSARSDANDPDASKLRNAIQDELVVLIDEWRELRQSDFTETANAPYSFLLRRTSEFIETILGRSDAQRFEDNGGAKPQTRNQLVDLRVRALSRLRDDADSWRPQVDSGGLAAAVTTRKAIDYGDAILIAGSPIQDFYEIPSSPSGLPVSCEPEEIESEEEVGRTVVAIAAPADGLQAALQAEREEGHKLLGALKSGPLASWRYDRVPSTEDIEGWKANVEHLLREEKELLSLFRWQPIRISLGMSRLDTLADLIGGGPETRRLEALLDQLDKVVDRISE